MACAAHDMVLRVVHLHIKDNQQPINVNIGATVREENFTAATTYVCRANRTKQVKTTTRVRHASAGQRASCAKNRSRADRAAAANPQTTKLRFQMLSQAFTSFKSCSSN
jgi:hypothetical protein